MLFFDSTVVCFGLGQYNWFLAMFDTSIFLSEKENFWFIRNNEFWFGQGFFFIVGRCRRHSSCCGNRRYMVFHVYFTFLLQLKNRFILWWTTFRWSELEVITRSFPSSFSDNLLFRNEQTLPIYTNFVLNCRVFEPMFAFKTRAYSFRNMHTILLRSSSWYVCAWGNVISIRLEYISVNKTHVKRNILAKKYIGWRAFRFGVDYLPFQGNIPSPIHFYW